MYVYVLLHRVCIYNNYVCMYIQKLIIKPWTKILYYQTTLINVQINQTSTEVNCLQASSQKVIMWFMIATDPRFCFFLRKTDDVNVNISALSRKASLKKNCHFSPYLHTESGKYFRFLFLSIQFYLCFSFSLLSFSYFNVSVQHNSRETDGIYFPMLWI